MKTYEVTAFESITSYDAIKIQIKANSQKEALEKAEEDKGTVISRDTLESNYEWVDRDKWEITEIKE